MKSRKQKRMEAADRLERYAPAKLKQTLEGIANPAGIDLPDDIRAEAIAAAHRHYNNRIAEAARLRAL